MNRTAASGSTWTQQQKVVDTVLPQARMTSVGANYGYSVAMAEDGLTFAVGAPSDASGANYIADAGAVYTFTRSGTTWSQQQKIVGTGTNGRLVNNFFGNSVALGGSNDDTLVVGTSKILKLNVVGVCGGGRNYL